MHSTCLFARAVVEGDIQTNLEDIKDFHLPTREDLEAEKANPLSPEETHQRIKTIITILSDFRNRRDPERYSSTLLSLPKALTSV